MATELELNHFETYEMSATVSPFPQLRKQDEKSNIVYLEEKMLATIDRAIGIVSNETRELRDNIVVDLRPYADAKSRALLDINRVMGDLDMKDAPPSVVSELRLLRQVLDDNEQLLASHLEAVREITELLSTTMMKADSDGTYTSDRLEPR